MICSRCKHDNPRDAVTCERCGADLFDWGVTTKPGQEIKLAGRYVVGEELGRGGMGIVYKAHDTVLDIDVAIKLLPPYLANDRRGIENLKAEAVSAISLTHSNIMRLHTFEDHPDAKFLVMEYIDGHNLDDLLQQRPERRFSEEEVVEVAKQVCDALVCAHGENIIHRDIKPSNVMLDSKGRVKVTDFGIARVIKDSYSRTTGQITSGTLLYMSPEQCMGERTDARSDIYSLGITMYELLNGEPPFKGGDISLQHLRKKPAPIPHVSDTMNRIVLRALEKKPENRFQSAEQLKDVLQGKAEQEAGKVEELPEKTAPRRGRRAVGAVLALALIAICAAGAWYWKTHGGLGAPPPKEPPPIEKVEVEPKAPEAPPEPPIEREATPPKEPPEEPLSPTVTVDDVVSARLEANKKRTAAEDAEAATHAKQLYDQGVGAFQRGEGYDRLQAFDKALTAYKSAGQLFTKAAQEASRVRKEIAALDNAKNSMASAKASADSKQASKYASIRYEQAESKRKEAESESSRSRATALYDEAEKLYLLAYQEADKESARIAEEEKQKEQERNKRLADEALAAAQSARSNAQAEKASEFAKTEWSSAETALSSGRSKYKGGDYAGAKTQLDQADTLYARAESAARKAKEKKLYEPETVLIKGGTFMMGSNDGDSDEKPVHRVTMDELYIGKYEVTNAQYKAFVDASGYDGSGDADSDYLKHFRGQSNMSTNDNHPIVWVSWKNAVAYCRWLSEQTGKKYRLPTEAEWEYACRGGTSTRYSFGDSESTLGEYAWYRDNAGSKTHEVGSKKPNAWGLYDMHGNVWEWCADCYDKDYYSKSPEVDPRGPTSGQYRVLRGGSWLNIPRYLRSAVRLRYLPDGIHGRRPRFSCRT